MMILVGASFLFQGTKKDHQLGNGETCTTEKVTGKFRTERELRGVIEKKMIAVSFF